MTEHRDSAPMKDYDSLESKKKDLHKRVIDSKYVMRLERLADDLLQLAERVAKHFEDTDAPLGVQARRLIERAKP